MKKVGRPTLYTEDIAEKICETICSTSDGLEKLCASNSDWPNPSTIYAWLAKHVKFQEMYARAKINQIQVYVDETMKIADDSSEDYNRSRLRIDTRKWHASKLVPRVYGNSVHHEGTIGIKHEDAIKELE